MLNEFIKHHWAIRPDMSKKDGIAFIKLLRNQERFIRERYGLRVHPGVKREKGTSFPSKPPVKELSMLRHYGPSKIIDGKLVEDHGPGFVILHHPSGRILCQGSHKEWTNSGFGVYFYPIIFTGPNAQKWIDSGCIGELQESFTNLHIGFIKNFWMKSP